MGAAEKSCGDVPRVRVFHFKGKVKVRFALPQAVAVLGVPRAARRAADPRTPQMPKLGQNAPSVILLDRNDRARFQLHFRSGKNVLRASNDNVPATEHDDPFVPRPFLRFLQVRLVLVLVRHVRVHADEPKRAQSGENKRRPDRAALNRYADQERKKPKGAPQAHYLPELRRTMVP